VELTTPEKVHAVIIGKSSGMKSGYVRATDAKQSVLASPQVTLDADPKRWLDNALVDVPEARIREIEVTPASGPSYKVSREKKEDTAFNVSGIPKGRELVNADAAGAFARELTSLTLSDVQKLSGAAPASPKAIYRTFDGLDLQLTG